MTLDKLFLTEDNHFQYGHVEGHPTVFFAKVNPPTRPVQSGLEEAVIAAKKIHQLAGAKKINLCVSGGIDSEVMLISFLEAKIPFEATILKFKDDLNDFDIFNVIEFCQQRNIETTLLELDVLNFFETKQHLEYGKKYRCQSPQIAVHLWLLDQVQGFPIMSGNFIYPQPIDGGVFYVGLPGDLHCTYFRYFETNHKAGIPWFLIYTPELNQSFLNTPLVKDQATRTPENQIPFTYLVKCEIYNQAGFDVKPRPDKFTGFEKIRILFDEKFGTSHGIKFDEAYRQPLVELNPIPEEFLQIVP
ncbi:MAG: hypothetical protein H7256_04220 [Bdellovibrio sp.]|nr:hypothetical protein [Bdellovibrio sp.]